MQVEVVIAIFFFFFLCLCMALAAGSKAKSKKTERSYPSVRPPPSYFPYTRPSIRTQQPNNHTYGNTPQPDNLPSRTFPPPFNLPSTTSPLPFNIPSRFTTPKPYIKSMKYDTFCLNCGMLIRAGQRCRSCFY